jgi:hypothetical protein
MSKIVAYFEIPGMTPVQYNAILDELSATGKKPDNNRPIHVAWQKGDNWCVLDVWNSQEELMEFGEKTLFPIFAKLGIKPVPPQIFPAYHIIGTDVEEFMNA